MISPASKVQVEAWLRRIVCGNWHFSVRSDVYGAAVVIEREHLDRDGQRARGSRVLPVPIFVQSVAECARWLNIEIKKAECHEVDEQFSLDGRRIFDPHRGVGVPAAGAQTAITE